MAYLTRHALLGLAAAVAVGQVACADRTGVLIEVTRDETTTTPEIDHLRFFVGVHVGDDETRPVDYLDGAGSSELVDLAGRDVLEEPYRMLLTPGAAMEMDLKVAVIGMAGGEAVAYGDLDEDIQFVDGSVVMWPVTLYGDSNDRVDVTETGCLIVYYEDDKVVIAPAGDQDCDNNPVPDDCDDSDPTVGTNQPERCFNEIDDNCNGETDEQGDFDGDGVLNCDDCDDGDDQRYPGNTEICDGIDNDCNEVCDDGAADGDGDTYTTCGTRVRSDGTCAGPSDSLIDCDDTDETTHPETEDVCDGVDNDCNGVCDDDFDPDGDEYTSCGSKVTVCDGTKTTDIDCEPDDEHAYPRNRPERCDGVDNDCDGVYYPESNPCYVLDSSGSVDACYVGERTCGDASGQGWTSGCTKGANNVEVPLELCNAYETCDSNDAADPFACANDMATATTYDCTIYHPAPSETCAPAMARLPNSLSDNATCRWYLSPAGNLPHYVTSLVAEPTDAGSTPSPSLASCGAIFEVQDTLTAPPVDDSYMLIQTADGAQQQLIRINLSPVSVTDCPSNGLECVGLADPVEAN